MSPTVSICIPAYRAERYLAETLASVQAQTFGDWELIVTEDGSRDRTEEIVAAFATAVPQPVRYTRHDPNQGLSATRNAGFAHARGEWIALLDADDLWTPDHLATGLALATGETDAIFADSWLFRDDPAQRHEYRGPTDADIAALPLSLYQRNFLQPSGALLRRSLIARVGGFEPSSRITNDLDYWWRILRAGGRMAFTRQPTLLYRKHGTALTSRAAEAAEDSARTYARHLDWEAIPARLRRRTAAGKFAAAGRLWRSRDAAHSVALFGEALALQPWRLDWRLRRWHAALTGARPASAATVSPSS
jgi:GT2 family glycosyltransferase